MEKVLNEFLLIGVRWREGVCVGWGWGWVGVCVCGGWSCRMQSYGE